MFLNFDTGRPVITRAPPTRAPMVLGIGMALYLVAIIFMSTQLLVKSKFGKLAVEDLLIFISSVGSQHAANGNLKYVLTLFRYYYSPCWSTPGYVPPLIPPSHPC